MNINIGGSAIMSQYHEPVEKLDQKTMDTTRALVSLQEEIEAVDWYNQRITASNNPELRAILEHNRNEEIEHAAMLIEWLRRNADKWDEELRTYLFTDGDITKLEEASMSGEDGEGESNLKIGDLK